MPLCSNTTKDGTKILKVSENDAATSSNFCASTVDIENNKTKKQTQQIEESNQNAIYVGFNRAGEYVSITNMEVFI